MTTRKRAPRIGRGECRKALALCWRQLSGSTRCDTHHTHPGVGAGALGIAAGTLLSPLLLSAGMNPLRGQNNVQGASDAGLVRWSSAAGLDSVVSLKSAGFIHESVCSGAALPQDEGTPAISYSVAEVPPPKSPMLASCHTVFCSIGRNS